MTPTPTPGTLFLLLLTIALLAALVATHTPIPEPPALAALSPRPTPTPTVSPTPGWWAQLTFAPSPLPRLPGLPELSQEPGPRGGGGPVPFTTLDCPGTQARIQAITQDGVWWRVRGTAQAPSLAYWKMELSSDGSHWTLLTRRGAPVSQGHLMDFHTRTVPPGSYRLRLVVVMQDGNYPPPCVVAVTVR